MSNPSRVPALALVLLSLASPAASAAPAVAVQDTSALQFHGIRAGARLEEIDRRVRAAGNGRFSCERSKRDRRVLECRGVMADAELGRPVDLWVSAMDSVAGVITLSAGVDAVGLDRWRRRIEARYGRVGAQVQGSQWMMQWVRRGRMLRLTWRSERAERMASVSLVDGRVLDGWGKTRASRSP
jgi:hypothetical protein